MAFDINAFAAGGLSRGGARPSLFQVSLTLPPALNTGAATFQQKFTFTCSATQAPASTLGTIEVPYFGRKVKLAGDRTFSDWQVNVMNDEDHIVRDTLEYWSNVINQHGGNVQTVDGNGYWSEGTVLQFSKAASDAASPRIIKGYNFINIWPSEVAAMDLDWDATNRIQTFSVTFAYTLWVPLTSASGVTINTGVPGNQLTAVAP